MSRQVKPASLAAWLEQSGTTQTELAEQLGVVPSHISMLVSGDRTPSLDLAIRIESLTGVPVLALAGKGSGR